jgi:integrase
MPRQVAKPGLQRETPAWNEEEVQRFLAAISDHRWAAPIRLSVLYGLRRSELLGLRWSAVDLKKHTVRIERALVEVHGRPEWSDGKNARSRRTISIDPSTMSALAAHRKLQAEERLAAGADWVDSGLVVATKTGNRLSPATSTRASSGSSPMPACRGSPPTVSVTPPPPTWSATPPTSARSAPPPTSSATAPTC